jgi:hypothetical protein
MSSKPSRSRGTRNPGRNASIFGLATVAGLGLVLVGIAETRATGRSGSPFLGFGVIPTILCPLFLIHYVTMIRVFRDLRSGRTAIARWVVPADEFTRFCEQEQRVPAHSIQTNFYQPRATVPEKGVEVIFSDSGVLIDDGYFPLSLTGGRRVRKVDFIETDPPSLEFAMTLTTRARTSGVTSARVRSSVMLRVPVANDARGLAAGVAHRYRGRIPQSR